MNLREFLESRVARQGDKIYLLFEDQRWSYRQFDQRVNQAANAFRELGIGKGDRVCLMLSNSPEFLFAWFGLNKIGGIMVPINHSFKIPEVSYIVAHCEAKGVVAQEGNLPVALGVKEKIQSLRWVAVAGESSPGSAVELNKLLDRQSPALEPIPLAGQDLASFIYTSGTTGPPKGVMHTHQTYILCGESMTVRADLTPADRLMTILPFFHGNAQFYSAMGSLAAEASIVAMPKFSASQFWEQAVKYKVTQFNFIGAVGRMLMGRPPGEFRPDHTIRVANGAPVPQDVYRTFTDRFRIPQVIDGYGLTECPGVCSNPYHGAKKIGSIGLPSRHPDRNLKLMEMKVVDENDGELPRGQVGELILRSPMVMQGYFKEPEQTARAMRGGWLHTGDYTYQDEDGYFYFVDRKKDILRRRGENISSMEVEGVINSHPKVSESAVIAIPSALSEDEVKAFIVLKEGEAVPPEEMIDWCVERLADFKIPRYIEYRQKLPKTPSERVEKYLLKKEGAASGGADMHLYLKKLVDSRNASLAKEGK